MINCNILEKSGEKTERRPRPNLQRKFKTKY